jgi:mono/diheme cytochrome c family protein
MGATRKTSSLALVVAAGLSIALAARARKTSAQESEATKTVWEGVYTEEQSKRGRTVYVDKCSNCHADDLSGGETATALVGGTFEGGWNGLTANDLFERIRISMPQDKPGTMSRQQVADVVGYIFDVNKFPRGDKELDKNAALLKSIRLVMPKPQ